MEMRHMKRYVLGCLAAAVALGLLAFPLAAAGEAGRPADKSKVEQPENVTVISPDGGQVKMVVSGADGKPMEVKADRIELREVKAAKAERMEPLKAGEGWLGVRISPVPAAVAAHLGLKEGQGAMIQNVVRGSPAEKAGLQRYDVVVIVGKGQDVTAAEKLAELVRKHKPGDHVELSIFHEGKKKELKAELGDPTSTEKAEYIYKDDEDEQWSDMLKLHRGMLRRTPEGTWTFEGQPRIAPPADVLKAMPNRPWVNVQVQAQSGGGKGTFKLSRTTDGKTVEMESLPDGAIQVRREERAADGSSRKTSTVKYKTAEELQKGDAEAHELYKGIQVGGQAAGRPGIRYVLPGKSLELKIQGKQAREAAEEVQKRLKELGQQAAEKAKQAAQEAAEQAKAATTRFGFVVQPPKTEFEVDADGRIKASVREGDMAGKFTFGSEQEMKEKAPKLYEQYQKLLKGR